MNALSAGGCRCATYSACRSRGSTPRLSDWRLAGSRDRRDCRSRLVLVKAAAGPSRGKRGAGWRNERGRDGDRTIPRQRTEMPHVGRSPRDVRCPRCGAAPHRGCETADGMPWANHAERIAAARGLDQPVGERSGRRRREARNDAPPNMPRVARERRLSREYVRGFSCPKCGAGPQALCVGERGQPRTQNHAGRVAVARASLSKRSAAPAVVRLWAAGVCPAAPGPGGWAAALAVRSRELVLRGGAALTTQHRMTLTAVIEGLRTLPGRR